MKRNVAIGSVAVFALLVAMFTVFWFYKAGQLKDETEQYLRDLNILALKEAPQYVTGLNFITFSSIDAYGFPTRIEMSFEGLRLNSLIGNLQIEGVFLSKNIFSDELKLDYKDIQLEPTFKKSIVELLDKRTSSNISNEEALESLIEILRSTIKSTDP